MFANGQFFFRLGLPSTGAFENTGLSFSCGRTRENRGDVVVVAFLCGGTKKSSNTPRVNANLKEKMEKKYPFSKILECV